MENKPRSEAQKEASRINGARSRGAVTAEGRARSALNGTKHGLYSSRTVLANESQEEFDRSYLRYHHEWNPVGQSELDLVRDIAVLRWKYIRILNMDDAARDSEMFIQRDGFDKCYANPDPAMRHHDADNSLHNTAPGLLDHYGRSMARLQRMISRATTDLIRLQKLRLGHTPVRNACLEEPLPTPEAPAPQEDGQNRGFQPETPPPSPPECGKTYPEPEFLRWSCDVDRAYLCPLKGPKTPPAPKTPSDAPYLDHLRG